MDKNNLTKIAVIGILSLGMSPFLLASNNETNKEDERLYAAAFKVDGGGRCLKWKSEEKVRACARLAFGVPALNDQDLRQSMALMMNTDVRTMRSCSSAELNLQGLPKPLKNELYACLPIKLTHPELLASEDDKLLTKLIVKLKQGKDNKLKIIQVVAK